MLFAVAIYALNDIILAENKILLGMLSVIGAFQFPFFYFLAKETIFILYDEIKNGSLTSKLSDLRKKRRADQLYSIQVIEEYDENVYRMIRMSY